MTTCVIWCRVPKTEQETANQLEELRQRAQRKGFEITREYVFEVSANNGSVKHRKILSQALADARLGRFEVMLMWALDRVSREGVEATLAVLRWFAGHGAAVWSLNEPWTETADPRMGELPASLYAWMAAEESRRGPERTRAGSSASPARRKAPQTANPAPAPGPPVCPPPGILAHQDHLRGGSALTALFAESGLNVGRDVTGLDAHRGGSLPAVRL